ncbi:MAG TPA: acyl-CoA synthetase [Paracoccaceae bacterium]|nr:acyl-CoA synthetase [Paracoccaceae bacterium]
MSHPHLHAARTPDKPAVIMAGSGRTLTYRALEDRSNQGAQAFRSLGIGPGGHVAVLMENRPEVFEIAFAAQRAGIYLTAVSRYLGPEEASYVVRDCGASVFVTSAAHEATAAGVRDDLGDGVRCFMLDDVIPGYESWETFRAGFPAERVADEVRGHTMLYSSGTTGRPKGIKRPFEPEPIEGGHPLVELFLVKMGGMTQESVYLSPAPLYHAAPLAATVTALHHGASVVVMEKFEPEGFLDAVQRFGATHTQLVPTMFVRMLKLPEETRAACDLSSLGCALHAAAPCPVEVKRRMIEWWGPILLEYYAGTEGNGVTVVTSEEWAERPGTVGRSMLGPLHVVGEDGEELPPGETGDVYFEGGFPFEYHDDPEKTAKSRHPKGWTTLGDVGYVDEDGYLFLTDRRAYTIISGGVNVYPQETEDRLIVHPKVQDAAVFGVPDDDFGEAVKAVVQLRDPAEASPELAAELIAWCRAALSGIKTPKSVDFREDLPRTETGKLMKRKLKDEYWAAARKETA